MEEATVELSLENGAKPRCAKSQGGAFQAEGRVSAKSPEVRMSLLCARNQLSSQCDCISLRVMEGEVWDLMGFI